jgi:hypothetical protein
VLVTIHKSFDLDQYLNFSIVKHYHLTNAIIRLYFVDITSTDRVGYVLKPSINYDPILPVHFLHPQVLHPLVHHPTQDNLADVVSNTLVILVFHFLENLFILLIDFFYILISDIFHLILEFTSPTHHSLVSTIVL